MTKVATEERNFSKNRLMEALKNNKCFIYKMIVYSLPILLGFDGIAGTIAYGAKGLIIPTIVLLLAELVGILMAMALWFDANNKRKVIEVIAVVITLLAIYLVNFNYSYHIGAIIPGIIIMILAPTGEHFKDEIRYPLAVIIMVLGVEFLNNSRFPLFLSLLEEPEFGRYHIAVGMNFYYVALLSAFIVAICNSKRIALGITNTIFMIFGIANLFVVSWTHHAIVPADFSKLNTALSVLPQQNVTKSMVIRCILGVVIFIINYVIIYTMKECNKKTKRERIMPGIMYAILFFVVLYKAQTTFLNFNGDVVYGVITNMSINIGKTYKKPKIMVDYSKYDYETSTEGKKPNVIIVMSEAFADLNTSVEGLKLSGDYMPYYKSLCEKYPSGTAYSSVYGNNTVTSEFEGISGTSSLFSTEGATIWLTYANENTWTVVQDFNAKGYDTYGMHPSYTFNYHRENAWTKLGFDHIDFLEYMIDRGEDVEYFRNLPTDAFNYKKVIDYYEETQKTGNPFFCFNVTVQNHSEYFEDISDLGIERITVDAKESDAKIQADNYFTLMKASDDALKELIDYFEQVEEETYILIYGDHQPLFTTDLVYELTGEAVDMTDIINTKQYYEVPYLIWNNKGNVDYKVPEYTSINYLAELLYDCAGIDKPAILNYQSSLRKEWPVITANFVMDKDNKIYSMDTVKKKMKKLTDESDRSYPLKVYESWTYDLIMGKE